MKTKNIATEFDLESDYDLNALVHGPHYVYSIHYHLVFSTKYRVKIFNDEDLQNDMIRLLKLIAQKNDIKIENIAAMPDHIHILVSFKPKYSLSQIVKTLKGASARQWFLDYPETKEKLWGGHLWTGSYFAASVGYNNSDIVNNYINNQHNK